MFVCLKINTVCKTKNILVLTKMAFVLVRLKVGMGACLRLKRIVKFLTLNRGLDHSTILQNKAKYSIVRSYILKYWYYNKLFLPVMIGYTTVRENKRRN